MSEIINPSQLVGDKITDASLWAKSFMQIFGNKKAEIDESLMIGWFANAIMVQYDKLNVGKIQSLEQEVTRLKEENKRLKEENLNLNEYKFMYEELCK